MLQLIKQHYPWFFSTYQALSPASARGWSDLARIFVLHKHGGVFLDGDIQCFHSLDNAIRNDDFVLQV